MSSTESKRDDDPEGRRRRFLQALKESQHCDGVWCDSGDSGRFFLSEPSLTSDDNQHSMYLSQDEMSFENDEPAPAPPSDNPFAQTTFLSTSPGNTSLSSRDSPHVQKKVQLQFSIDNKKGRPRAETSPNMAPYNLLQPSQNVLTSTHKAADNSQILSSISTSSASIGQAQRATDFLQDLKRRSVGALVNAAPDDFDSDRNQLGHVDRVELDAVIRARSDDRLLKASVRLEEVEIEQDESFDFNLSESEVENNAKDESSTQGHQHSADDEQTRPRPRRHRQSMPKPNAGHRRSRSGDEVAAKFLTGGNDWKGMQQDRLPIPTNLDDEELWTSYDGSESLIMRTGSSGSGKGTRFQIRQIAEAKREVETEADIKRGRTSRRNKRPPRQRRVSNRHRNQANSGSDDTMVLFETPSSRRAEFTASPLRPFQSAASMAGDDGRSVLRNRTSRPIGVEGMRLPKPTPRSGIAQVDELVESVRFRPLTNHVDDNDTEHPTFICPQCGTKQREFFTAVSAPYLRVPTLWHAFYLGLLVILSLSVMQFRSGLHLVDCIYFAVVTVTTVGFGDIVPTTNIDKIICSIFIYIGLASIGLFLGTYLTMILDERSEEQAELRRVANCIVCQDDESDEEEDETYTQNEEDYKAFNRKESRLSSSDASSLSDGKKTSPDSNTPRPLPSGFNLPMPGRSSRHISIPEQPPGSSSFQMMNESSVSTRSFKRMQESQSQEISATGSKESEDSSGGFETLISENSDFGKPLSQVKAVRLVFNTLKTGLATIFIIVLFGTVAFHLIEGFDPVNSFYFTTVLLTTVGYGDLVPKTNLGKIFATVYVLVGGTVLLNNLTLIGTIPLELRKRRIERAVLTQFGNELDDAALRELATGRLVRRLNLAMNRSDGLDECTREMFALAMLVRLGKVTERDIRQTFLAFQRLDVDREGVLNSKTIIAGMVNKQRSKRDPQTFNESTKMSLGQTKPAEERPKSLSFREKAKYWIGTSGSLHVEAKNGKFCFPNVMEEPPESEKAALLSNRKRLSRKRSSLIKEKWDEESCGDLW